MAKKRVKKKKEKRALAERAGKIKGITPKQADKLTYSELTSIIAHDNLREKECITAEVGSQKARIYTGK